MDNSRPQPSLRREGLIRTIHSSLAIENNTLSLDQVADIIDGKRILGPPNEIREVKNAYEAYELLLTYNPRSLKDLLKAHKVLMTDLTYESGRFRSGGVGVYDGEKLVHMAPPAALVPELMADLVTWTKTAEAHPLVKSCVFHYEFVFIHPFADGNGRMARMWQTLLLAEWKPVFARLPVESVIKERQSAYYDAIENSNKKSDSTDFILFMLTALRDALAEALNVRTAQEQISDRVKNMLELLGKDELSAAEIMGRIGLKNRPSFRGHYLLPALAAGLMEMTIPDKPNSSRQKYRRVKIMQ
ncbi:MAG: Fic family protein [Clostridiales Family XIII bacterium]|nr:Fic family protein [Clostridiales Family XIII bacterium]